MSKVNDNVEAQDKVNDTPMTPEEFKDEVLFNEREILSSMFGKAKDKEDITVRMVVRRPGDDKPLYSFRIRPLTEKEYNKCREKHTRYKKHGRLGGIKLPESTDNVLYHSELIYASTIDEDREKIWDNKTLWNAANALTGVDMIEHLIPWAGVKQRIVDKIEELSGYNYDDDEDDVKN